MQRFVSGFVAVMATFVLIIGVSGCADDGSASGSSDTVESGGTDAETSGLSGAVRDPQPDMSSLSLPNASDGDAPMRFVADPGHLLLAYFGYTSCPDVCPTTLADVKAGLKQLGADADRVDLAMATIDPRRDTGEILTGYVRSFVPNARALRTEDEAALRQAASAFGASYEVDYADPESPEVAHSAYTYVLDSRGKLVLEWPFGTTPKDMANDLRQLLATAT